MDLKLSLQMNPFELKEDEFEELLRLCRLYRREAEKCEKSKSYLAGLVMIAAALEADLTLMCHCYSDEIPQELIPKRRGGKQKHLLDWTFFQLLRVARECQWLPSGLLINEDWEPKKAKVGDYAIVLKEFRNLVHPSCFVKDYLRQRLTRRKMKVGYEILDTVIKFLLEKLNHSLKAAFKEMDGYDSNN
jgi:hypothetical protein